MKIFRSTWVSVTSWLRSNRADSIIDYLEIVNSVILWNNLLFHNRIRSYVLNYSAVKLAIQ